MPKQHPPLSGNQAKCIAYRVSGVGIAVNVLLTLFKLAAGFIGKSGAMLSDAVHSASDIFSTIVVMLGIRISSKQSDHDHPYGHDKLECVAAVLLAVLLFATGVGIGLSGLEKILSGESAALAVPGSIALAAAAVSIAVKEWMFWYTRAAAKKIGSGAMMADAWHHRSDALSSVGSFAGILGARLGYPILDPIASVVICIFILKAAVDIFRDAVNRMVDKACDEETQQQLHGVITAQHGVRRVDLLSTRLFGSGIYVDVEIAVDGTLSLYESHAIAEQVHDAIEAQFPSVKHCMVHVNPCEV